MKVSRVIAIVVALAVGTTSSVGPVGVSAGPAWAGTGLPGAPRCPLFPSDNVWNTDISGLPVNARSAAWISSMQSAATHLHPDFGLSGDPSNPYGMPVTVVSPSHPLVQPSFLYAPESDAGPRTAASSTSVTRDSTVRPEPSTSTSPSWVWPAEPSVVGDS